jgi:PST family polysaccharide transporter
LFGAFDAADCWLQARNQARTTSLIRLIGFVVGALARCLLILSEASVEWFAAVVLLESAVVAAMYYRLLLSHGLAPSLSKVSMVEFKHLVVTGKMMVLSGLTVAIYSKIDVLVVGALLSKEAVGAYAIAASMCAAWNMVGMSVAQAWAPRISESRTQSQLAYVRSMRQLLLTILALSLAGSAFLSWTAGLIFSLLLGPSYANGAAVFSVLVWSSVFVFTGVATSQIIVNERIYWVSMLRTVIGLMFCIVVICFAPANWSTVDFAYLMVWTSALATLSIAFSAKARNTLRQVLSPA